jgi:hypothetical protein
MEKDLQQDELDELISSVLLHSTKTRSFLKRLRAKKPEQWQRAYGNISNAYFLLAPRQETVTRFLIGVFDPDIEDSWPWHFDYQNGVYLSLNYRQCKRHKAAEFDSAAGAREFFHAWGGKKNLKMELIEVQLVRLVEPYE